MAHNEHDANVALERKLQREADAMDAMGEDCSPEMLDANYAYERRLRAARATLKLPA
jgi:hypothetical protein